MEQTVEIKTGTHSTEIPRGADKLFENLLELAGFKESFRFKIMLGGKRKGSGQCKEIEIGRPDSRGRSVIALAKPGDNGSRFEYYIFRPDGFEGTLEDFFNQLKDAERKFYEERVPKETDPVLEDLGAKPQIKGDSAKELEIEPKKPAEQQVTDSHNTPPLYGPRYRMVSKILDEEIIKIILTEIRETGKDHLLQIDLKNTIKTFQLECDERQIIKFLKDKGYMKEERHSKHKTFFSLSKKGEDLLKLEEQSGEKKQLPQVDPTDLVSLSKEYEKIKTGFLTEKELYELAEKKFLEAKAEFETTKNKFQEIKRRMEKLKGEILATLG